MSERDLLREQQILTQLELFGRASHSIEVRCFDCVASTMDTAKEVLTELNLGSDRFLLIDTLVQQAGRGRQGRSWFSAEGNLSFTLAVPSILLPGLPLLVSCSLHKALLQLGAETLIKWPNDLLTNKLEKICGVLIERKSFKARSYDLIGVGLNISESPKAENASHLAALVTPTPSRDQVLLSIVHELVLDLELFLKAGWSSFREYWLRHTLPLDAEIAFNSPTGKVNGNFKGISERGELQILISGKLETFSSGDLILVAS